MSEIANTSMHAAGPSARWFGQMLLASAAAVRRLIRLQRDRRYLHELPDYLLQDIGIGRSEIHSATAFRRRDLTSRRTFWAERDGR